MPNASSKCSCGCKKHDVQTPSSIYTSRESTVTFCETLDSPLYRTVFLRCRHSWSNRDSGLDMTSIKRLCLIATSLTIWRNVLRIIWLKFCSIFPCKDSINQCSHITYSNLTPIPDHGVEVLLVENGEYLTELCSNTAGLLLARLKSL